MEDTANHIFREQSLKKAAEPEQLDGYLRVTGFGPWFVLLAAALVLAAIFVWAFFGKLQSVVTGAGYCENGKLLCYVVQKDAARITEETTVDIEGVPGTVTDVNLDLYDHRQVPNDVRFLLPESRWYSTVELSCPLEDGLYTVNFYQKAVAPASFMTGGTES